MPKTLLISALSITSLFLGNVDTEAPIPENILIEDNYEIINVITKKEELERYQGHSSLLYMAPAKKETEKSKNIKESVRDTLQEREEEKALKKSAELTIQEKERIEREWEDNFPVYDNNTSEGSFINKISRDSIRIAKENGIYPSVMIAQAGHESNWGRSGLAQSYNNLMGTKGSWKGKTATMRTGEHVNGKNIYINAGFSVYDSWNDSLERYGQLLSNGLNYNSEFYAGTWRANTNSYKDATAWLQGRYATDNNYTVKLNRTIEKYKLDRFDDIQPLDEELNKVAVNVEAEKVKLEVPSEIYTVKEGDSLLSIALMHDMTVDTLLSLNTLKTPTLEENQWLSVTTGNEVTNVEDLLNTDIANHDSDGYESVDAETLQKFGF